MEMKAPLPNFLWAGVGASMYVPYMMSKAAGI